MLNTRRNEIFNANDVISSNDLRKRIINIDSRFRQDLMAPSTDFLYRFDNPYKNVIRVRVASVEIPNMYYTFTSQQYGNTSFKISSYDYNGVLRQATITIRDGNYSAVDLLTEIQSKLHTEFLIPYGIYVDIYPDPIQIKTIFSILGTVNTPPSGTTPTWPPTVFTWSSINATYTTKAPSPFSLDFSVPRLRLRPYNNGLGFHLGFRQNAYTATTPGITAGSYMVKSESCIDVIGDMYCFLAVDDFNTVSQQTLENSFECLAKIVIREEKGNAIYDDGSTFLTNDVIFPSPIDLKTLRIQLRDPYGNIIDLNDMNFSFSLEITEVMNVKLYEFYRNYIWLGQLPQVPQDVRGTAAALLGGRGP